MEKGFVILEQKSKNLIIATNDLKQRLHVIDIHESDLVMAWYTAIIFVANTIKKFHIMPDLNFGFIHNFYNCKQYSFRYLFCRYIKPLLKYISHTELIQEWNKNIDAVSYEKYLNEEVNLPSKKKEIDICDIKSYWTTSII